MLLLQAIECAVEDAEAGWLEIVRSDEEVAPTIGACVCVVHGASQPYPDFCPTLCPLSSMTCNLTAAANPQ